MFLADERATSAQLLDSRRQDESAIGHMVCHSATCFSGALMYIHEVIVTHEELAPTLLDTLRYQATKDYRPTLPTTEKPTDMRPHVPQHDATNHTAKASVLS